MCLIFREVLCTFIDALCTFQLDQLLSFRKQNPKMKTVRYIIFSLYKGSNL